jgi:GNAT superfamily N-acetyltransferase
VGELWGLYVDPEAWGSGAAAALLAASVDALRGRGFTEAVLWVLEDNPRARRFYEREGWTADGARKEEEFLGVVVTEIRYRRRL